MLMLQRMIIGDVRHHTTPGVQLRLPVTGGHLREGGKTGDFLQDARLHETMFGREDQLIVVAAVAAELGVVALAYLPLKPKLQLLIQLWKPPLPLRG